MYLKSIYSEMSSAVLRDSIRPFLQQTANFVTTFFILVKLRLDISCELSAGIVCWQTIHMEYQSYLVS